MTVLVFDSGIGGLSVLREARLLMHEQQFVYVGDDAGFPYGDWEEAALTERMVGLFDTLMDKFQPQLAIVACNTASTLIMPALRERFSIPFVGIVPAIKPAAERTASGLITVLATPGTVSRPYTKNLIKQFGSECEVRLVGATQLARMAEQHMQLKDIDTQLLKEEIRPCFVQRGQRKTDIVALGCTHYPFLVNEMRKIAPWPVDWLDPAYAVAQQARRMLEKAIQSDGSAGVVQSGGSLGVVQPNGAPGIAQSNCLPGEVQSNSSPGEIHSNNSLETISSGDVEQDLAIMTSGEPSQAISRLLISMGMQLQSVSFPSLDARVSVT